MSRTDWPQELDDCGNLRWPKWLQDESLPYSEWWMPTVLGDEAERRWRIYPAAMRLSDALDTYLHADHNSDARKLETAYIELLDAQRDFEIANK